METSRVGDAFTETGKHERGAGLATATVEGVVQQPAPYSLGGGEDLFPPKLQEVAPPLTEVLGIEGELPPLESFFDVSNLPRVVDELAAVNPGPADPNDKGTATIVLPDWAASIIKDLDSVTPDWARWVIEGLSQPDASDFILPLSGTVIKTGAKGVSTAAKVVKTTGSANALKLPATKAGAGACAVPTGPLHHIATNKNTISALNGGPWTPRFKQLFDKAGMTLDDAANKVHIPGHHGPHPEAYHDKVFDLLTKATKGLSGKEYKDALLKKLGEIGRDASTPGTTLNTLLTN